MFIIITIYFISFWQWLPLFFPYPIFNFFFFFTPLNNPIKYSPTDVLSNEIYTIVNY